jgi:hypothetical protein
MGLRLWRARRTGYSGSLSSFVGAAAPPPHATLPAARPGAAQTTVFFLAARAGTPVGVFAVGAGAGVGECTVGRR